MSCSSNTTSLQTQTVTVVPLEVARGSVVSWLGTVWKYTVNYATLKQTKIRADLTGALIEFAVKRRLEDSDDEVVIYKSSANGPTEIEILPQVILGVDQTSKGNYVIKLLASDTEELDPSCCYVYDVWVTLANGSREPVIDTSPFCIVQRVTPVEDTPAPIGPSGDAAPQTPQERSFTWTVPSTDVSWTVTIPLGGAMHDATYGVWASMADPVLPAGLKYWVPSATRTTTQFVFNSEETIQAGSVLTFFLRDF